MAGWVHSEVVLLWLLLLGWEEVKSVQDRAKPSSCDTFALSSSHLSAWVRQDAPRCEGSSSIAPYSIQSYLRLVQWTNKRMVRGVIASMKGLFFLSGQKLESLVCKEVRSCFFYFANTKRDDPSCCGCQACDCRSITRFATPILSAGQLCGWYSS